ncbi:MAG: AAA family ATPase [Bacillota bacterium]
MRFSRVSLENWRNFKHVEVSLSNRAFLVGPNASGKSNFLDAFRFLHDIASLGGGLQQAVTTRGGVSRIRCLAARRNPDVVVNVDLSEGEEHLWRYRLAFSQDNNRRPIVKSEQVWRGDRQEIDRPDENDRDDPDRLYQTNLEQVMANKGFRDVAEFFRATSYYHIVPQLIRDPDRSAGKQADPFGGDFLEQVSRTQKKTQQSRLKRIREALRVAIPQLKALELFKDERGIPHLRGKYQHWRSEGAWQTELDFSDGTLRLMGLLWTLLAGSGPILLEEPELSLHPEVVRQIPQMIARVQRKRPLRQVMLSTHSSDLLSDEGIGVEEVLLFMPGEEGTRVNPVAHIHDARSLLESGINLAEIAMAKTSPRDAKQLSLFGEQ